MKGHSQHNFDSTSSSPQGNARILLLIDRLFTLPYKLIRFIFIHTSEKRSSKETIVLVVKLMGLGSLTKFASMCEQCGVDKKKIKLVTFEPNRELCELLDFKNVFFLRTSGLFSFTSDCWSLISECWRNQYPFIVDYERCSHAVGTFRLFLCWISNAQSICFENIKQDYSRNRLSAFSIQHIDFEMMLAKGIAVMPKTPINDRGIQVPVALKKIMVNVNASEYLLARRYPILHFLELFRLLHSEYPNSDFHFTGSDREHGYVEKIVKQLQQENIPAHNHAGLFSLEKFCRELTTCRMFITCDSGPLHMAAYLGVPTLAIWGPTHYRYFGYDKLPHVLNCSLELPCSPCFIHPYSKPAAACNGNITCLQNLTPQMLFKKATILLDEKSTSRRVRLPMGLKPEGILSLEGQLT